MADESNATLDDTRAAIIYSGLTVALIIVRKQREHSASKYHEAIDLQIDSYEAERARIVSAFPSVAK